MPDEPTWWEFSLLALAAFRSWRLLAEDDLLDRPRRWALRLGAAWQRQGDPVPEGYRSAWAKFLTCAWCSGAWVALGWWIIWLAAGTWVTMLATPFAVSAAVGLIRDNLASSRE